MLKQMMVAYKTKACLTLRLTPSLKATPILNKRETRLYSVHQRNFMTSQSSLTVEPAQQQQEAFSQAKSLLEFVKLHSNLK